jgi:hypothetical protein
MPILPPRSDAMSRIGGRAGDQGMHELAGIDLSPEISTKGR